MRRRKRSDNILARAGAQPALTSTDIYNRPTKPRGDRASIPTHVHHQFHPQTKAMSVAAVLQSSLLN